MKIRIKNFLTLVFCLLLLVAKPAAAAAERLYFSAPTQPLGVGSEFPVKLLLDSDQPVNAYVIKFIYPVQYLEILNFNDSRSIIDIWQGQPVVSAGGEVTIKGGSIKPFSGVGGEILTVNFKALAAASTTLDFEKSNALYLANGKGTKVMPQGESLLLTIQTSTPAAVLTQGLPLTPADNLPPEIKFLSIIPDPFNKSQKLLGFLVSDADSGVKETSLRTRSFLWWGDWMPASNPTALPLRVWSVDFRVVDNAGNVTEKIVYDWGAFLKLSGYAAAGILVLLLVAYLVKMPKRQKPETDK